MNRKASDLIEMIFDSFFDRKLNECATYVLHKAQSKLCISMDGSLSDLKWRGV